MSEATIQRCTADQCVNGLQRVQFPIEILEVM